MALNFNQTIVLSGQYGSSLVSDVHIGNEPANDIYQYYIEDNHTADKKSKVEMSNYELAWSIEARSLTSRSVKRIGIKTFPQVGAIGFYTFLNEARSKVVVPIHVEEKRYSSPSLSMYITGDKLNFTITDPEDTSYICYRIIVRLGKFATEYITYDRHFSVDRPYLSGEYEIYCVGYMNEGEAVSEDSNYIVTYIEGSGIDPTPANDIYVTAATFDKGYLNLQMSNGQVVRSINSVFSTDEWHVLAEALGVNEGFSSPVYESLGGDINGNSL